MIRHTHDESSERTSKPRASGDDPMLIKQVQAYAG